MSEKQGCMHCGRGLSPEMQEHYTTTSPFPEDNKKRDNARLHVGAGTTSDVRPDHINRDFAEGFIAFLTSHLPSENER